jgi:DNA primase
MPPEAMPLSQCNWSKPPFVLRKAIKYLRDDRGVNRLKAIQFDAHYAPSGRYAGRIVFPVYQNGQQVYFTTRYAGEHERKSLNPYNEDGHFHRDHCLLNYDAAVGKKVVAIVEGVLDCMAHKAAVALLGKRCTETQAKLLEVLADNGTEEFVVSLDPGAGREADAIYQKLSGRVPKVSMLVLDHGDPHDRREELPELMKGRRAPSTGDRVRQRMKRD